MLKEKVIRYYAGFIDNQYTKIIKQNDRTNVTMNLVKTYGIIAVVCSHTKGGGIAFPFSNWFSPFYYFMPLFVFASGYFYNAKYDLQVLKYITINEQVRDFA